MCARSPLGPSIDASRQEPRQASFLRAFTRTVLVLVAFVWAGTGAGLGEIRPAAAGPGLPTASLDHYLEQFRAAADAPGVSAAIAVDGEVVYVGATGFADVGNEVRATGTTVYNIGSVSKVNAVVGILELVERGLVDLDAPIQTWAPGFPERTPAITLRHVLTHTSGIRHYRVDDFGGDTFTENKERFESIGDGLEIFLDDELDFPTGRYWSYSSYATNLLQAVVESVTDTGFEEFLHDAVWAPAGMLATAFDVPERIVRQRSRGYRRDPETGRLQHEPYGDVSYKFAGGGMISTVVDQVRFGVALNHGLLLEPETLEQMYEPMESQPMAFDRDGEHEALEFSQALIWRIQEDDEGRLYASHGGSVLGFRSALVNFLDDDVVVAVMVNSASRPMDAALDLAKFVFARGRAD